MSQLSLIAPAQDTSLRALPAQGRIAGDAYYTPDALASACVAAVHAVEPIAGVVWEPHVGGGAWARALLAQTEAALWLSDLDPGAAGLRLLTRHRQRIRWAQGLGFLDQHDKRADWVIGNPPYADAEDHVRHALACSRRHVVMLLRLAFLESQGRVPFWRDHPCRCVWALAGRPSFTACGKTDSAAYGLFWWDHERPEGRLVAGWDWQAAPAPLARTDA